MTSASPLVQPGSATGDRALTVRGLTRTHRGGSRPAVDNVNLDVGRGELFGLLGPNGAGKTTFVRLVMGLLRPGSGTVLMSGADVVRDPAAAAIGAAYLAQDETALDELSVGVAVETTARLRGLSRSQARSAAGDLLDELGLAERARSVLRRLSGGERRLACVATALVGDRPLLLLDEPTTGLDPVARRAVWAALERRRREQDVTVVLVTHNVLEAETVLDRVAVLEAGRVIACGTPGRLKAGVSDEVRLDLVWRSAPPTGDPTVAMLAARSTVLGRRWSARLPADEARRALSALASGPVLAALDDFTLATPTLEDVYLTLGGTARDLERE